MAPPPSLCAMESPRLWGCFGDGAFLESRIEARMAIQGIPVVLDIERWALRAPEGRTVSGFILECAQIGEEYGGGFAVSQSGAQLGPGEEIGEESCLVDEEGLSVQEAETRVSSVLRMLKAEGYRLVGHRASGEWSLVLDADVRSM